MKYEEKKLSELVDTISDTRKIDKDKVVLVNTSDVLAGEVLNHTYTENCNLRGQFKKRFKKDDILYSEIRPANKRFAYIDFDSEDYIASTKLMVLRRKSDKITNRYLYYCLTNDLFVDRMQHLAEARSGTFPQITFDVLKGETIYLPSIANQNKITSILDNINNKIRLNNEINNNLYELVRSYYIDLVNNSDEECSLSELMEYQGGSQPPASQFEYEKNEDNIRFVQIRDFDSDSHICYIPNSSKNKLCSKKDILIARYGASLGRICYGLDGAYNVALAKVLPVKEEYREMLRVILESKDFYNYINQVGQRSAQAGFNAGDIAGYTIKIPEENAIIEFNKLADKVIDKRMLLKEENEKLSQLRDTLLPKLINGEIDLDSIEI